MELIKTKGMTRDEWLAARRMGIGGSDVAAILGHDPYRSPVDVWLDKMGVSDDSEKEWMYWGSIHEEVIAREYAKRQSCKVQRFNFMMHQDCLIGDVDRLVSIDGSSPVVRGDIRTDLMLECKTANAYKANEWGQEGTDDIPRQYIFQCLHYLGLTGCAYCDVAVLIGGSTFKRFRINSDREIIGRIQEACQKWWVDHIKAETAPGPRNQHDVNRLFGRPIQKQIQGTAEHHVQALKFKKYQKEIKELQRKQDDIKLELCSHMEEATKLVAPGGNVLATWTEGNKRTDWKALAQELMAGEDHSDLIAKHTKQGDRIFRAKV